MQTGRLHSVQRYVVLGIARSSSSIKIFVFESFEGRKDAQHL
jgi:hypothetical protein